MPFSGPPLGQKALRSLALSHVPVQFIRLGESDLRSLGKERVIYSLDEGKSTAVHEKVFYSQFIGGRHSYEPEVFPRNVALNLGE